MAEVKWIKITTDIFDDEKILLIESLPDAYAIITVWFKLLCLAGKQNNSGVFMMGQMPYTDTMMATIFRMKESTVTMALRTFEQFGMVEIVDGVITIPNWGKHQNLDQLESKKQYMKGYMAEYRRKQKALTAGEGDCKTNCKTNSKTNVSQAEEERDKEEEKERDVEKRVDCQQVVDLYHSLCKSFPKVRTLTDARKKAIRARLNTYSMDDFKTVFTNAENSAFLKGSNNRNWTATFDWLIKDGNMAKVLEGNYADKPKGKKEIVPEWMAESQEQFDSFDDFLLESIRRKATAADDDGIKARAEALKKELGGE